MCATHPLILVIICTTYGKKPSITVHAVEHTQRFHMKHFISFTAKSWLNDLEDVGHGQRSLDETHPLIPAITYGKNPSRTLHAVERTSQAMRYFSSFSTLWPNGLEEIGHGQRSLYVPHLFMLVIICANYRKNSSRTVCTVDRKRHEEIYFSSFIAQSWLNDLEDIGQGQGSLRATHPYRLVIICATYGKSPPRTVHAVERPRQMPHFSSFTAKSWPNDFEVIGYGLMVKGHGRGLTARDHGTCTCFTGKIFLQTTKYLPKCNEI